MGGCYSKTKVEKKVKHVDKFNEAAIVKKQNMRVTSSANPKSMPSVTKSVTDVNDIFAEFLALDRRLQSSKDYEIDPAGRQLFTSVNEAALSTPVFQALQAAQGIYHSERGHEIIYSAQDRQKQETLIDFILKTATMQRCLEILKGNRNFKGSKDDFGRRLYEIWFHLWGNHHDTCAFEHVFVGERVGHVNGFHNWVQYYRQQQKGNIQNYTPIPNINNEIASKDSLIVAMSFDWLGQHKRIDSMFIGTTPAFEMAIYIYLFFSVQEEKSITPVHLGVHDFEIHMIKNGDRIITTYPEVVD